MAKTITAAELFREIEAGTVPEILDVRNKDEFAASKVEANRAVPTRNAERADLLFARGQTRQPAFASVAPQFRLKLAQ